MEEIGAEIVAFRDIDHSGRMVSVRFHQGFEVGMRDERELSAAGFALVRLTLPLILSFGRSENRHRECERKCQGTRTYPFCDHLVSLVSSLARRWVYHERLWPLKGYSPPIHFEIGRILHLRPEISKFR